MSIKQVAGRFLYTKDELRGGRTNYKHYFGADHRSDPAEVVSEVNRVLTEMNVNVEFVYVNCGDDSYWFGAKKVS